jgi:hypothetical protein
MDDREPSFTSPAEIQTVEGLELLGESSAPPPQHAREFTPESFVPPAQTRDTPHFRPACIDPPGKYPQAALALDLLSFVMAGGARALFRGRAEGSKEDWDIPYRATVFWPVRASEGGEERLYPFLRARFGEVPRECKSPLYFLRREIFAGAAWATINDLIVRENLPALADCGNDYDTWRRRWLDDVKVDERIINMMGRETGYATRVRSLACVGMQTSYGPIVLCIDSVRQGAFETRWLTEHAVRRYEKLSKILGEVVPDRVTRHRDFWTWAVQELRRWRLVLLSALGVMSWLKFATDVLGVSSLPAQLGRMLPALGSMGAMSWAVTYALLLALLPTQQDIPPASPLAVKVTLFVRWWRGVWLFSCLAHVAAALREFEAIRTTAVGALLSVAAPILLLIASCLVLACCSGLGGFVLQRMHLGERSEEAPQSMSLGTPLHVLALVIILGIVSLIASIGEYAKWFGGGAWLECLRACPAIIMYSVALCLLVGRIGSRLMGTPTLVSAFLYLNAILWPLSNVFGTAKGSVGARIATGIITTSCLLSHVLLFVVVLWAIQGRGIERYLRSIEDIAWRVPWRSLKDAWRNRGAAPPAAPPH